ncbi:hypothetical protein [Dyadobacter luticola]|uniref:Lipocalin-like domain-containing protein n=1 Tax=Dyadobacter luticola TaxID=1979387 RepID=A0A5R9L5L8_9BACT|nr:hypothetical protein [Dyadobacter luticola]TLV03738.1 hypothetical protein FEN17_09110 [Dyadobacter luticola]
MRRFTSIFLLLLLAVMGCEKEPVEPNPLIKPLVGKWKLTAIQIEGAGIKSWQDLPFDALNNIEIRHDGVILDYKQEGVCCHPASLNINGSIVLITRTLKVPDNTNCVSSCIQCQVWTFALANEEMTLTGCVPSDVKKYKKL